VIRRRRRAKSKRASAFPRRKGGDRVLFGKYSGTEIKNRRRGLSNLREDEILAKLPARPRLAGGKR